MMSTGWDVSGNACCDLEDAGQERSVLEGFLTFLCHYLVLRMKQFFKVRQAQVPALQENVSLSKRLSTSHCRTLSTAPYPTGKRSRVAGLNCRSPWSVHSGWHSVICQSSAFTSEVQALYLGIGSAACFRCGCNGANKSKTLPCQFRMGL